MRRKWSLAAVSLVVLFVAGMVPVLAQGPGKHPRFATIKYVDQMVADLYEYIDQQIATVYNYVDEQIGGGGVVAPPPWELPAGWEWGFSDPDDPSSGLGLYTAGPWCAFGENASVPVLGSNSHASGIAHFPDREVYLRGDCTFLYPYGGRLFPEDLPGSAIDVDMWIEWLGETKHATYTVSPPAIP